MTTIRLVTVGDAPALLSLRTANRAFLTPWEPDPPPGGFTLNGQREAVRRLLSGYAEGTLIPHVILDGDRIIGRITLSNIIRGPFQSCFVGYWVAQADNGRGHATAAVARVAESAFEDLGLHRLEAGTLPHNKGSQEVLRRNGFTQFGHAPRYLRIAGRWQDHILFQKLNPAGDQDAQSA
jgi:[ribosomal protein S5]-alanine N-acetyltransferase